MSSTIATPQGLLLFVNWNVFPSSTKQAILEALSTTSNDSASGVPYQTESYPINLPQVRQLVEGIGANTTKLLQKIVDTYDAEQFDEDSCWINFAEAWALTGANDQAEFAKGPLSGLHRRLRNITGEDKAKLVLTYEEGGSDGKGCYYIDNRQAVLALREHFKLK